MLVCEDVAVNELLHLVEIACQTSQRIRSCVFSVADNAQEEVIGSYSIASRPHGFVAGVVDDCVEFVRYADFHNVFYFDCANLLNFSYLCQDI